MGEVLKQLTLTLMFSGLANAGGRKFDGYLMGIYGGSYCASTFIKWIFPTIDKFNSWLVWVGSIFDKGSQMMDHFW